MARVKGSVATRKRRKRILKLAKGYYGAKHKLFKTAKEQVMNSYYYAFRDRRQKKRDFRKLWIARINAAANLSIGESERISSIVPIYSIMVNAHTTVNVFDASNSTPATSRATTIPKNTATPPRHGTGYSCSLRASGLSVMFFITAILWTLLNIHHVLSIADTNKVK